MPHGDQQPPPSSSPEADWLEDENRNLGKSRLRRSRNHYELGAILNGVWGFILGVGIYLSFIAILFTIILLNPEILAMFVWGLMMVAVIQVTFGIPAFAIGWMANATTGFPFSASIGNAISAGMSVLFMQQIWFRGVDNLIFESNPWAWLSVAILVGLDASAITGALIVTRRRMKPIASMNDRWQFSIRTMLIATFWIAVVIVGMRIAGQPSRGFALSAATTAGGAVLTAIIISLLPKRFLDDTRPNLRSGVSAARRKSTYPPP